MRGLHRPLTVFTIADGNIQLRYNTFYPWDVRCAAAMDDKNLYLGILRDGKALEIAEYKDVLPMPAILAASATLTANGNWFMIYLTLFAREHLAPLVNGEADFTWSKNRNRKPDRVISF